MPGVNELQSSVKTLHQVHLFVVENWKLAQLCFTKTFLVISEQRLLGDKNKMSAEVLLFERARIIGLRAAHDETTNLKATR